MAYIHTCPKCSKQYTVYYDGEYICDCGECFEYPARSKHSKRKYRQTMPTYLDSSSRSMIRKSRHVYHRNWSGKMPTNDCPVAKGALIFAILSLVSFGILAPPALIMGFAARNLIADKRYRYTGDGLAIAAIIIGTISLICWGVWLMI